MLKEHIISFSFVFLDVAIKNATAYGQYQQQ